MTSPGYARPDFAAVTAMALDYAVAALVLPLDAAARARARCASTSASRPTPTRARRSRRSRRGRAGSCRTARTRCSIRWCGAPGSTTCIDGVISVDEAGVYKPSPRVYALAAERLGSRPRAIAFVSANGWDAAGAQAFGFTAIWINRAELPVERHAPPPAFTVGSLRRGRRDRQRVGVAGGRDLRDRGAHRLDRLRAREALALGERDRAATAPACANGTGTTSRLWYLGVSASRGSTETPRPDATMLRTVSSELVRAVGTSWRLSSGQASSTWSRKQWPTFSRIACSPASSSGWTDLRFAHLCSLGTTTWNGSS